MKPKSSIRYLKENDDPAHHLYQAIAAIQSVEEAARFFQDLCTPAEIESMADRWGVVDLIKEGKSYRSINEITGVSVTTIGRVARHILHGSEGYNLIFQRLNEHSDETYKNRDSKAGEVK